MGATAARLAAALDTVNRTLGTLVRWAALGMLLLQFAIVVLRYVFGMSFIVAYEGVLYLHAALFMLGAGYTLWADKHVRVDVLYSEMGGRRRAWIDLIGSLVFLMPMCVALFAFSIGFALKAWGILEGPISVGGIPASFLLKSLIPAFAVLLLIQGAALALRSVAYLAGAVPERGRG
jgi:TRAP-type mannitol/chloroaromatic compound transport system permease small subunit